jgi:hypothetical protein
MTSSRASFVCHRDQTRNESLSSFCCDITTTEYTLKYFGRAPLLRCLGCVRLGYFVGARANDQTRLPRISWPFVAQGHCPFCCYDVERQNLGISSDEAIICIIVCPYEEALAAFCNLGSREYCWSAMSFQLTLLLYRIHLDLMERTLLIALTALFRGHGIGTVKSDAGREAVTPEASSALSNGDESL